MMHRFPKSVSSLKINRLAIGAISLLAVGCGHNEPAKPQKLDLMMKSEVLQSSYDTSGAPAQQIIIKQGELPLVWLSEATADLQFLDLTDKQTIGDARVEGRKIIKLDAVRGIAVGSDTIRIGPLPKDHRYAITLVPSRTSQLKSETGTIAPPARPHAGEGTH